MGDRDGKVEPFTIHLNPGSVAPRYDGAVFELTPQGVTITERGMKSGLPMVDFTFVCLVDGKRYAFTTSGRMVLMLAAALRGVNLRNHGTEEP
jgi:hypothetical protein